MKLANTWHMLRTPKGTITQKKFEMTAELFNYENFTKEMLASVIEKIGEKDWFAVEKLVILTP
ncbi:hypothetical protein [Paenibacillus elgii]|uniref:hypothetical protein n=1 Tax=Paenibacillus elgii TaxID=189691 RepID=UPI00111295F9|nr:hypothetical protein [Paenibacillus elgii]